MIDQNGVNQEKNSPETMASYYSTGYFGLYIQFYGPD